MAWDTRATYAATDPPERPCDFLQAIASDIRVNGGDRDYAGYSALNLGSISGASGALSIAGNVSLPGKLGVGAISAGGSYTVSIGGNLLVYLGANEGAITLVSGGDGLNNIYLEAFSSDMSASATSLNFTGRFGGDLPLLNFAATKIKITAPPAYANNAAAISGGLSAGMLYVVSASNPRQIAIVY